MRIPGWINHAFIGLLIKRARTTSANGEQGSSSENGGIVYARSLVSASSINKSQVSGPRTYMRFGVLLLSIYFQSRHLFQ